MDDLYAAGNVPDPEVLMDVQKNRMLPLALRYEGVLVDKNANGIKKYQVQRTDVGLAARGETNQFATHERTEEQSWGVIWTESMVTELKPHYGDTHVTWDPSKAKAYGRGKKRVIGMDLDPIYGRPRGAMTISSTKMFGVRTDGKTGAGRSAKAARGIDNTHI